MSGRLESAWKLSKYVEGVFMIQSYGGLRRIRFTCRQRLLVVHPSLTAHDSVAAWKRVRHCQLTPDSTHRSCVYLLSITHVVPTTLHYY